MCVFRTPSKNWETNTPEIVYSADMREWPCLDMFVRELLDGVNWGGKAHPKWRWCHSVGWVRPEKRAEHQHSSSALPDCSRHVQPSSTLPDCGCHVASSLTLQLLKWTLPSLSCLCPGFCHSQEKSNRLRSTAYFIINTLSTQTNQSPLRRNRGRYQVQGLHKKSGGIVGSSAAVPKDTAFSILELFVVQLMNICEGKFRSYISMKRQNNAGQVFRAEPREIFRTASGMDRLHVPRQYSKNILSHNWTFFHV